MTVSATHEARHAATAASAADPPASRISIPAAVVAGWPAATAAGSIPASLWRRPRSRPYVSFRRRAGIAETSIWRLHDSDQGSQAGDCRQARPARGRHRFAGGADRPSDHPDQRAHRASAHAREGSLLAPRPAQARRSPPPAARLPPAHEPRWLPRPDQGARPAEVGPDPESGSLSERLHGADSNSHSPRRVEEYE